MIGSIISHYKILEKLGGGGMGVVYKAEDITLKRIVALKFLPSELTSDQQAKTRFLHEAQAASKIDHPNICGVHDIGQTDEGETYIVMSYYEGETLKKKIARGRLKVEQALELAAQIADGLAKAHAAEIIHRDIKPANILVTKDGIAKILDFGLAKLKGETKLTQTGSTVGTLSYMAPEQVQGQPTDVRSDIWSLGVVLYEMLTGNPPFKGEHEGALLYEIMSADPPPVTNGADDVDPELQQLVMKCLEKDPEERYQSVKDVSVDCRHVKREMKTMRQMSATYSGRGDSPSLSKRYTFSRSSKDRRRWVWIALACLFFCSTLLLALREYFGAGLSEEVEIRSTLSPPENGKFHFNIADPGLLTLSSDGKYVAFLASGLDGKKLLWIRMTNQSRSIPLPNTEDAAYPFWSPDNKWLGFFSGGKLKRINLQTGSVAEICIAPQGGGGSWNKEDTIIFSYSKTEPIYKVPASGGSYTQVTRIDTIRKEIYHQFPHFLPDGRHFLFLARNTKTGIDPDADTTFVGSLDGLQRTNVLPGNSRVIYSSGHLLYDRSSDLMARPFDLNSLKFVGNPLIIAEGVQTNPFDAGGIFTASRGGLLAYQQRAKPGTRLRMFDRNGTFLQEIGTQGVYFDVRFSPDGRKLAYSLIDSAKDNLDIWVYDLITGERKCVAFSDQVDRLPVWSPDSREIVFMSKRSGQYQLYRTSVDGKGKAIPFLVSSSYSQPFDWSRDGKFFAYVLTASTTHVKNQSDIWIIPMTGDHTPFPYLEEETNDWDPRFSPDGKWITYCSGGPNQEEIFVSKFPTWDPIPVSSTGGRGTTGGRGPRWAREGKEIFYLTRDLKLMVAELSIEKDGIAKVSRRTTLFQTRAVTYAGNYDVSPDGSRIIINSLDEYQIYQPVELIVNWPAIVRKK